SSIEIGLSQRRPRGSLGEIGLSQTPPRRTLEGIDLSETPPRGSRRQTVLFRDARGPVLKRAGLSWGRELGCYAVIARSTGAAAHSSSRASARLGATSR